MNFLFDNNLPPNWPASIAECSKHKFDFGCIQNVMHLMERFPNNISDTDYLSELGQEKNWVIISSDAFKKKNGDERRIIRKFGLSVFILQPSWATYNYWDKYSQFIKWWPRIVDQANKVESTVVLVPWRASGRFKQL